MVTKSKEIQVREAAPSDRPEILKLMRMSLGQGDIPRTEAFWRWKHEQNPFGPSPVLLAEADDQVVGLRTFLRWQWKWKGRTVHSVRAVDTATHPDWWGRGIFKRLTMTLVEHVSGEGVQFVFNTPNEKSRPGYLKMGWSSLGRVSLWILPRRTLKILTALASPTRLDEDKDQVIANDLRSVADLLKEPDFERVIASHLGASGRLATAVAIDYLRWRYSHIPGFRYLALWDFDNHGDVVGIFRVCKRRGLRELRLCELMMNGKPRARRVADVIQAAGRVAEADFIATMAPISSRAGRALVRAGFLPAPYLGPIVTVLPLQGARGEPNPLDRSSWAFSIGDLELF